MNKIDIRDLDVIFLTYDEPLKEEYWLKIKNIVPWAKRVDNVKGSDSAHKAAANASDTERFVLVDGDNIPDPEFFNCTLELDDLNNDHVFRWKARNHINGLVYGNGGISCWTKTFVNEMRTHENTDGRAESTIEFCYERKYRSMHDCYSITYPNATPFQAWRAGFREGVKLCLNRGTKLDIDSNNNFIHSRNYELLSIWHSVGQDVQNGWWAIYGARLGTYLTLIRNWDYSQVRDFDRLRELWNTFKKDDYSACERIGETLKRILGLKLTDLDSDQSAFFKTFYEKNHKNIGINQFERHI